MINKFFGVDTSNLKDLWKLMTIQAICCLIPLAFIWLLPLPEEVKAIQKKNKDEEAEVAKGHIPSATGKTAETEPDEGNQGV